MPRGQYDRSAMRTLPPETDTARPTRADNERRARRMKPGSTVANGIKLGLNEEAIDRTQFQYRFVREDRVERLKAMDWDPVNDSAAKTDGNGLGSVPTAHGGLDEGQPYGMVLMQKYKDWYDEDQGRKLKLIDEKDEQIRRGKDKTPETDKLGSTYTPNGENTIERV